MEKIYTEKILSLALDKNNYRAAEWMASIGLLQMKCVKCNSKMELIKCSRKESKDLCMWICESGNNFVHSTEKNVRKGTLLEHYTYELYKYLRVVYFWSKKVTTIEASERVGVPKVKIGYIYNEFREICVKYFKCNPIKMGASGKTVLVVKNRFSVSRFLILAIIDIGTSPIVGFLKIVNSFEELELDNIIKDVVKSEHRIPECNMKAYENLIMAYRAKHFDLLNKLKTDDESRFNSYLSQAMWLDRFGDKSCYNFCKHIKEYYKICKY